MLIKSLKLNNIRSYLNEEIKFPTSSVLLSGDIGSGKSSVLLAIEFALFGTDQDRLSGEALLRKGKNEGSVELRFNLEGKDVIIKRALKRGKRGINQTAGFIIINGLKKEGMPVELKTEIINLLRYPSELVSKKRNLVYRYTVYCPQEEMKAILVEDEESRLNTLRKIFGIDKYKKIRENCLIYVKELKTKQKELEIRIEDLEQKKKEQQEKNNLLEEIKDKLKQLEPREEQFKKEINSIKEEIKDFEKQIKELNEFKKEIEVLSAQEKEKQSLRESNQKKEQELKKQFTVLKVEGNKEILEKELEEKETKLNQLIEESSSLKEKYNSLKTRIRELNQEIEEKINQIKNLPEKRKTLEEIKKAIEEKQAYQKKKQEIEKSLRKLNEVIKEYEVNKNHSFKLKKQILALSKCPICQQSVSKEHKEHVHQTETDKILVFEKRLRECLETRKQKEEEFKIFENKFNLVLDKEKDFARLKTEITHLNEINQTIELKKKNLNGFKIQENELGERLEKLSKINLDNWKKETKEKKEILEKLREKENLSKRLNEIKEQQEELDKSLTIIKQKKENFQTKIKEFLGIEEKHQQSKQKLEDFQEKERELLIEKAKAKTEEENINKLLISLNQEIERKNKQKEKLFYFKQIQNWLEKHFISLMGAIERQVMLRIYHEFNSLFKEWFSVLMEDETIAAQLDDRFNPLIIQNGYEVDIRHLSGGERTSAALAYRLALNKVVNDVIHEIKTKDLIILDEPTDGFSSEQLDKIREVLEQLGVKQCLIVSHESKIESFVENVIRINKSEGVSKVIS